jgi:hypothetical protein
VTQSRHIVIILKQLKQASRASTRRMAVGGLTSLKKVPLPPSARWERMARNPKPTNHLRAPDGVAFPLPSTFFPGCPLNSCFQAVALNENSDADRRRRPCNGVEIELHPPCRSLAAVGSVNDHHRPSRPQGALYSKVADQRDVCVRCKNCCGG